MKKLGRNDPCWCGSGRKFKKCHLNRDRESAPTVQQLLLARKRIYSKRYCLHPNAGAECRGNIIKAHTIQRNGGLSRIAKDGHVYTFFPDHASMIKGGDSAARLVGINNASTFTGFCGLHDNATFEPIEKQAFSPTEEHAFLLGYRAICKELFGKRAQLELIPISRENDKGQPLASQLEWQDLMNYWTIGVKHGIQVLDHHKSQYDNALQNKDYSEVRYYIIRLAEIPDLMCSGGIQPDNDFTGRQIQSLVNHRLQHNLASSIGMDMDAITQDTFSTSETPEVLAFSVIGTDNGGAVIFTWMGESPICRQLVGSLDSLSDQEVPHAIVRFAFHYFENIFTSPSWWDNLDDKTQIKLLARQREGGLLDTNPKSLIDDGVRAVSWEVKARLTNYRLESLEELS